MVSTQKSGFVLKCVSLNQTLIFSDILIIISWFGQKSNFPIFNTHYYVLISILFPKLENIERSTNLIIKDDNLQKSNIKINEPQQK